jgi:hypothetical protein
MLNDLIVGRAALALHPAKPGEARPAGALPQARPRQGLMFRRRLRWVLRSLSRLASG